jgi:hypothetical protein
VLLLSSLKIAKKKKTGKDTKQQDKTFASLRHDLPYTISMLNRLIAGAPTAAATTKKKPSPATLESSPKYYFCVFFFLCNIFLKTFSTGFYNYPRNNANHVCNPTFCFALLLGHLLVVPCHISTRTNDCG